MTSDPNAIAERLGVPPALIRRLRRRGYLRSFDLDLAEVRLRLWLGCVGQGRERARHEAADGDVYVDDTRSLTLSVELPSG